MINITTKDFAQLIDYTLLKPYAKYDDFVKLCNESIEYGFKMVAISSAAVELCKKLLDKSNVNVGAAVSFPLGQTTIQTKIYETQTAIQNGADEIDYVINICKLKDGDYKYIQNEMQSIVDVCNQSDRKITSKVIFENCYLTKNEIETLCKISLEVKPDFIKTSTGFGTGGATLDDIKLMKQIVGDNVKVKAAGGIRDLDTAIAMIEAGAQRLGTSAGVEIIKQYNQNTEKNCTA